MAQKKKPKRLKWGIIIGAIVLALILVFVLVRVLSPSNTDSTSFSKAKADMGTVEVNVVADGNLSSDAVTVNATMGGFVSEIVKSGAQVKKGDKLALIAQNPEMALAAQADYDTAVRALDRIREKPAMPSLVMAPDDGRVYMVNVKKDDDAGLVCDKYGQLMVIATGIKVALPDGAASEGSDLTIKANGHSYDATAETIGGKLFAVSTSNAPKLGDAATVLSKKKEIASGKIEAVKTEPIKGMGTVKDVYVDEGQSVSKGGRLVMLAGSARERDIADQQAKVLELKAKLDDVSGDGAVTAGMDGWISDVKTTQGVSVVKDQSLFVLQPNALEAVVDASEVDVVKLKEGQSATITLDALPDKTYTGKVDYVAGTGAKSGDTVNYQTRVSIDAPTGLLPGMSCQVNILIDHKDNVLRIPTDALLDAPDGGKMVIVATGDASKIQDWDPQASATINISNVNMFGEQKATNGTIPQAEQRIVTVGLVNEYWAEITSGINKGETVLIPIRNSSSIMSMFRNGGQNIRSSTQTPQSSPAGGTGK